jgi:hypothetical protein
MPFPSLSGTGHAVGSLPHRDIPLTKNTKKIQVRLIRELNSVVLPPGVPALGAAEEPHFALIGSPQLAQPPDGEVVIAFRAADLDRGHGFYFFIPVIDNGDLILCALLLFYHLVSPADLPDISASPALEMTRRRDQHGFTFRAEHRYNHAQAEEIKLWLIRRCEARRTGTGPPAVPVENPFFGLTRICL